METQTRQSSKLFKDDSKSERDRTRRASDEVRGGIEDRIMAISQVLLAIGKLSSKEPGASIIPPKGDDPVAELQAVFIMNLKKERGRLGISQLVLAERAQLSPGYIGEIESGRKFPSIDNVERLARALEVPPYRLYMSNRDLEELFSPEGKPGWARAALVRWAAEMLEKYEGEER